MRLCRNLALVGLFVVLAASCSSQSSDLETAEFHLDNAEYTEAIAILESVIADDATNQKATILLAEALLGRGFIGTNALGFLADALEGLEDDNESNLESLQAIIPTAAANGEDDIFRADDLLNTIVDADKTAEDHLIQAFIRLAVINIVFLVKIGAAASDDVCDYNFSAVSDDELTRGQNSLSSVNDSFVASGITDFRTSPLGEQITNLNNDLTTATSILEFFNNEFPDFEFCP